MSLTLEDFQAIQQQVIELKTENYNLREQLESTTQKGQPNGHQQLESLRSEALRMRVHINQAIKDREILEEQVKSARVQKYFLNASVNGTDSHPDIEDVPPELQELAGTVLSLMDKIKEQITRRAFLDTQVNELGKRAKSLGRTSDQLQTVVDELREKQKTEIEEVEKTRQEIQRIEGEIATVKQTIQKDNAEKKAAVTEEDLRILKKREASLKEQLRKLDADHAQISESRQKRIDELNRILEDSLLVRNVAEKKLQQKIWTFQTEINKRRGIVIHSSTPESRQDSTSLFMESKDLIQTMAKIQQAVWELEERVSFTRKTVRLMGEQLISRKLGECDPNTKAKAMKMVLEIASMERQKAESQ